MESRVAEARIIAGEDGRLSTNQLASLLGKSKQVIRHHASLGRLPGTIMAGRDYRYPVCLADPELYRHYIGGFGRSAKSHAINRQMVG